MLHTATYLGPQLVAGAGCGGAQGAVHPRGRGKNVTEMQPGEAATRRSLELRGCPCPARKVPAGGGLPPSQAQPLPIQELGCWPES